MVLRIADKVHEFRPKPADTEKITINLGYVDLGHVNLMVQEGFYTPYRFHSNRNPQPTRAPRTRG
jgi:ribbon-helix-helix protein